MKKIEFSVFTNLSKDELAMQKALEAEQQRFGKILSADVSDSNYSRSLEQDKYSAIEQLKVAEDLELAEFRMKTFSKPFVRPDATIIPPSSSSVIQSDQSVIASSVSKNNINPVPVINIKLKKRKISDTVNNSTINISSSSSSSGHSNSTIDSESSARKHDASSNNHIQEKNMMAKPFTAIKSSSILSATTLPSLATPAEPPSALPLYYSDDDDDDNDGD